MNSLLASIGALSRAFGRTDRRSLSSVTPADQRSRSLRLSLLGVCLFSVVLGFGLLAITGVVPLPGVFDVSTFPVAGW
jgi:hypothetical protein